MNEVMDIGKFSESVDALVNKSTSEELQDLYDEVITINFHGMTMTTPFDAVAYNSLCDMLTEIIKQQ